MNFNIGNSTSVQGFKDELEEQQQQQQGTHLHHQHQHNYPCSNASSSNHEQLQQQQQQQQRGNWFDRRGGGGGRGEVGGVSTEFDVSVMDTSTTDAGHDDEGEGGTRGPVVEVEREHMFDKVVTPSDVGKLNRLVIPKQHAERYFPLDSSTNEKGLLLNFEDRNGKSWRFRYSYWNSSQSYVMTKGWSRFVKEKKLDAGDIVSFQRGVGDLGKDRLFIDWRRRPDAPLPPVHSHLLATYPHHHHLNFSFQRPTSSTRMSNTIHHHHQPNSMVPWNPVFVPNQGGGGGGYGYGYGHGSSEYEFGLDHSHLPQSTSYYGGPVTGRANYGYSSTTNSNSTPCSGSVIYFRSLSASGPSTAPQQLRGNGMQVQIQERGMLNTSGIDHPHHNHHLQVQSPVVFESVPVVHGKAASKRLRLFGVNMDCSSAIDPSSDTIELATNTTTATTTTNGPYHQYNTNSSSSSSSSSTIPYLQLTPYYTDPASSPFDKAKTSMSLDLDI